MNRSPGVSMSGMSGMSGGGGFSSNQEEGSVRPQLKHLFVDNKYFAEPWHDDEFMESPPSDEPKESWRLKEKMKTSGVALVVCLNIGTDPPDIVKPTPCARRECWFDPTTVPKQKGLEVIGNALQQQYEKWHSKAKYKQSLDPTSSELERTCVNLRRQTRTDRLLLHYNGHGVPRPTKNGELWVFGKHYTHYMPINVFELRNWLGDPSIYVLDCSGAGALLPYFADNSPRHGTQSAPMIPKPSNSSTPPTNLSNDKGCAESSATSSAPQQCIVLAACQSHEMLPLMNPLYPADIFTACLTTPIPIAVRWFILQNPHISSQMSLDISENIPGKDGDRKTPKGELNWIFTAVADTIAWSCLPSVTFQKLFRQDLLVASLFRNFLLAKRIMKSLNCSPQSIPIIPDCATHPLWHAWDAAVEHCLLHVHACQQKAKQMAPASNTSPTKGSGPTASGTNLTFGAGSDNKSSNCPPGVGVGLGPVKQNMAVHLPTGSGQMLPPGGGVVPGPMMFGIGSNAPPQAMGSRTASVNQPQMHSQQSQRFGAPPSFNVSSSGQTPSLGPAMNSAAHIAIPMSPRGGANGPSATSSSSSPFFSEQMTAFEIWLDFGGAGGSYVETHQPPMCLPILLQALLSHAHRLKALHLLRRYVALGPEAVHSILAVGNYPYILKLLHNPVVEIRYVLMSIWTYVIGFDRSCREELVKDIKDKSKSQFMHCLQSSETPHQQRTMAAFIQAEICNQYKPGQLTCLQLGVHKTYIRLLAAQDVARRPHLKKWLAFCLAKLCEGMPQCKKVCMLDEVQLYLYPLLMDPHPFVRGASLYALGELFGASSAVYPIDLPTNAPLTKEQWNIRGKEVEIAMQVLESCLDGCASVRREAVVAIAKMIMLPIHFDCLKHVATAIFEYTGETSFYSHGYLRGRELDSEGRQRGCRSGSSSPAGNLSSATRSSPSSSPNLLDGESQASSKSKFSIPSPLKPKQFKNNSEVPSSYLKQALTHNKALTIDTQWSASNPPSPERQNKGYKRSNSFTSDDVTEPGVWSMQSDHTMTLIKSVQDMIEARMDLTHTKGSSVLSSSPLDQSSYSNTPPPPPMMERDNSGGYSVGISFEDFSNSISNSAMPNFNPPPAAFPQQVNNQRKIGRQQQQPLQQQQHKHPAPEVQLPMNSQLSLQMATSYVHLWLMLTDVQNSDPHPIVSKSVRAIFMHMKVEVAKEVFSSAANDDQERSDSDRSRSSPTDGRHSTSEIRGEKSSPLSSAYTRNMHGDREKPRTSHATGSASQHSTSNNNAGTLLHMIDRPGQEYGQHCIGQDMWLRSSIYDWNRLYFLRPDIGYNPYEDLLSDVGKERSLRMLMREEVKSLSNRIVDHFRPIRDDGMPSYNVYDPDSHDHEVQGNRNSVGRGSVRDNSLIRNSRSSSGGGQEDDGFQAALLPASLTKFESKGIIRIEQADLSTSSLMFHAFHDILAISDNQGVGIWSLESGNKILHVNSTSHLSTFSGMKNGSTNNSGLIGRGPMSPVRYQHQPLHNLPYHNSLKPTMISRPYSVGRLGARSPTNFNDVMGSRSFADITQAESEKASQVGGHDDPCTGNTAGGRARPLLNSGTEVGNAQVTSMHWINESMDTLLMVGTDDGNIRIFRDVGSGIESAMQTDRERAGGAGGGGAAGLFSHEPSGDYRHSNGHFPNHGNTDRGSIYSSMDSANVTSPGVALASAFQALPDITPRGVGGSGMITSWQQSSGMLSVGGNSSTIRLWDVAREMSVTTFKTGVETCLTCLVSQAAVYSHSDSTSPSDINGSSNQEFPDGSNKGGPDSLSWGDTVANSTNARDSRSIPGGSMRGLASKPLESSFAWSFAGFADGSIGVFDQRVSAYGGKVLSAKEHSSWIVSAHLRADIPEIITGAYSGVVNFWDIRSMRSYKTIEVHKTPLTSLTVHNCAPIMATGSHAQFIKILTLGGDQLGMIRHHEGFMGQRIGPVASLAFHPIRLVMAAACTDNLVSIYSIQDG